jgi:GSH-dependent disulfide-bond oxidoreductase
MQWLLWQMGGLGPMLGQNHHFRGYAAEKITYAIERYTKETERLYSVLDERLADREFVAGDYSIADMACYPWIVLHERQGQDLNEFMNLKRWFETIQRRDAVQKAYALARTVNADTGGITEEAKKILFGQGRRAKSV